MANYLTQEYQVTNPPQFGDLRILDNVMTTLQGKYDANAALISQTLSMYDQNLKGLKESDNQYIAEKLKAVKNQIDLYSKKNGNLARNYNRDSIMSAITDVLQDPIVQDAVTSRQVKMNFDAEMAKKQEKGDGKFNDRNYQDALEQGGFNDYMQGKTKKLTGFRYSDYIDTATTLSEKAKTYAKDFGLQERYLGTDTSNPYYYEDKYGKVITKEEVYSHLKNTLSEQEKTQLAIDTRQSLAKLPDVDYTLLAKDYYSNKLTSLKESVSALEAKKKSEGKDVYNSAIKEAKDAVSAIENKMASSVVPKDDMYDIYTDKKLKDISSSYDFQFTTKIDRDKLPFDILKFNTETSLKLREIEAKEKANTITEQSMGGTPLIRETPEEEQVLTDTEKIQKAVFRSASAFDQFLNENVEGYSTKTPQEQWDYKMNFNPKDLSVKGNTPTANVLYEEFITSQKAYANLVDKSESLVKDQVSKSFNDLSLGKANLGNLALTMPLTAEVVQTSKGVQFDSLPEVTKKAVVAEWASNKLQYDSPDDNDVATMYRNVVVRNKTALQKEGSDQSKVALQKIQNSTKFNEDLGLSGVNVGRTTLSGIKNIIGERFDIAELAFNSLFSGTDYAKEQYIKSASKRAQKEQETSDYLARARRGVIDYLPIEDTNISELETQDLAIRNGATSTDVSRAFSSLDSNIKNEVRRKAESFQENIKEFKAFNFSTESKEQENMALSLRATVIDAGGSLPDKVNDYTLSREGASWRVDYTADKERTSVLIPKIDPSIVATVDARKANWLKSPKNPNVLLEPQTFTPIVNPNDTYIKVQGFVENIKGAGVLPPQALNQMMENPAMTPFASVSDYIDRVKKDFGKEYYERNKTQIDNILSTNYTATPYNTGEAFAIKIDYVDEQGNKKIHYPSGAVFPEKDNTLIYLTNLTEVEKLKYQRIKNLKE